MNTIKDMVKETGHNYYNLIKTYFESSGVSSSEDFFMSVETFNKKSPKLTPGFVI